MPIELPADPKTARLLRLLDLFLVAVLVFLLFYLGAQPGAGQLFPEPWDKLAHFLFYGGIAGMLRVGLGKRGAWAAVMIAIVIGAVDELHQRSLPGRSADWADFFTDVFAAFVAVAILHLLSRRPKAGGKADRGAKTVSNQHCGM